MQLSRPLRSGFTRPVAIVQRPGRHNFVVVATLTDKGRRQQANNITVKKIMGEGSFGQVFEGALQTPQGTQRVVLKRVKSRVAGAEEIGAMEHLLNVYASRAVNGHCADFVGYCEVSDDESTSRLTPGLWLLWKYEGTNTLSYYLRRRDTVRALATDMGIDEENVVPTVMKQLCESLAAFHNAGLVHRDVKPLNIIYAEETRRFKLIDLGACADLRSGTNYKPDESILDPNYCPPEQYILPTDAPHLAKTALKLVISPVLWAVHKPDRFDMWSAGLVLMQLACPPLRNDRSLRNFYQSYQRNGYDLLQWKRSANLLRRDSEILDADNGAGWDLAQNLLRERHIEVSEDGGVSFVAKDNALERLSAAEALRHRFMKQAVVPSTKKVASVRGATVAINSEKEDESASQTGKQVLSGALSSWRNLTNKLFDLEAKITQQQSATEKQSVQVKKLKQQAASGDMESAAKLEKESRTLSKMGQRLEGLKTEWQGTADQAKGMLSWLGFGKKSGSGKEAASESPSASTKQQQPAKSGSSGKSWSGKATPPPAPVPAPAEEQPAAANFMTGIWMDVSNRLMSLQSQLRNQASATEKQKLNVKELRQKVAAGDADKAGELAQQEYLLGKMSRRLSQLQADFMKTRSQAEKMLQPMSSSGDKGGTTGGKAGGTTSGKGGSATQSRDEDVSSTTGSSKWKWWFNSDDEDPALSSPSGTTGSSKSGKKGAEPAPPPQEESTSGSVSLLYQGLKLTSMAGKMASDIAGNIKADAEKVLKEMEQEANQKKAQRAADTSFMLLLKERVPSMAFAITYERLASSLKDEPRWQAVALERRQRLYSAYMDALQKAEMQARAQAEANLKDLYRQVGVSLESKWEDVVGVVQDEPRFKAVAEEASRREVFEDIQKELQLALVLRQSAERAEKEFRQMLEGTTWTPPLSSSSTWPLVKSQVWQDPRYSALPEQRRKQIFERFLLQVVTEQVKAESEKAAAAAAAAAAADAAAKAAAKAAAAAAPPAPPPPAPKPEAPAADPAPPTSASGTQSVKFGQVNSVRAARPANVKSSSPLLPLVGGDGGSGGDSDLARLQRDIDAKMKEMEKLKKMRQEMEAMESRLREVESLLDAQRKEEARLAANSPSSAAGPNSPSNPSATPLAPGSVVSEERDGSLVFTFPQENASSNGVAIAAGNPRENSRPNN